MSIVYLFGNPLSPLDASAPKLLPFLKTHLPDITFIHADPSENWWKREKNIVALDTVRGITDITVFDSLSSFAQTPHLTPHDYDLYTDLMLMIKLGRLHSFHIIAIPEIQSKVNVQKLIAVIRSLTM